MGQIPLNISSYLSYHPANFVLHGGAHEAVSLFFKLFEMGPQASSAAPVFRSMLVVGAPRSGKTHLSLYLADEVIKRGGFPRLIEGKQGLEWEVQLEAARSEGASVVIVDDVDKELSELHPGESGRFVSFFEALRVRGVLLLLISRSSPHDLPCDEHVTSRLLGSAQITLAPPEEEKIMPIVELMARQRGLSLDERELSFLKKRLPRDIKGIEDYFERVNQLALLSGKPIRFGLLGDAV